MYNILLGLLLIGEALALWAGMHWLSNGENGWTSFKNDFFLFVDILSGSLLLLGWALNLSEIIFWVVFFIVVASHSFREYEYLTLQKKPFCSSLPLFIVNNLKIILSMSTAVIHLTFI
jgi:hypothetical protein